MTTSSQPIIRWRLAQLASHLVVALVTLIVIGGATRVMEAGLACPDWPLCFGSFLPRRQMNVQVFLEWFHRLDAFFVGLVLLIQMFVSYLRRDELPSWMPLLSATLVVLVIFQGSLGALTVFRLLPSGVVTAHLACGLLLLVGASGISQALLASNEKSSPLFWRLMSGTSLAGVVCQCLLGGRMASAWAAQKCFLHGQSCQWLNLHRFSSIGVAICVLTFAITSIVVGGWSRTQWPWLTAAFGLVILQISIGFLSVNLQLSLPVVTVAHQLVAALLVALLSSLAFKTPQERSPSLGLLGNVPSSLETCNG